MKAAIFEKTGGPEVIHIADVADPDPGPGDVRIRVVACALNHLDLWVRRGLPILTPMPHIGGSDVAGIVDLVGSSVDNHWLGARVVVNPTMSCGVCDACTAGEPPLCASMRILGEHTQGGFAEYVVAPAANLLRVPDEVPLERVAAAPLAFATAWRALASRARLRPRDTILITGASGGVATAAIQIARFLGARVLALTSSPHVQRVKDLGAHLVYDRTQSGFGQDVWRDTDKRGVDVVLDSVGQAIWHDCIRCLTRGGRLVTCGATTGHDAHTDLRHIFYKQLSILGSTMSNPTEFLAVMDLVLRGTLRPVIHDVLPLDRLREAHELLEAGSVFGKVVLDVGGAE